MAYNKTPQEHLNILRQSSLNRAVDLYIAGKIEAGKLEATAEYFVSCIYAELGILVGGAFTEAQTNGAIILQSSLTRATALALAGIIDVKEIIGNMGLFGKYVYEGVK